MRKIHPFRQVLLALTGIGTAIGIPLMLMGHQPVPPLAWFEPYFPTASIGPMDLPFTAALVRQLIAYWPAFCAILFIQLVSGEMRKALRAQRTVRKRK